MLFNIIVEIYVEKNKIRLVGGIVTNQEARRIYKDKKSLKEHLKSVLFFDRIELLRVRREWKK